MALLKKNNRPTDVIKAKDITIDDDIDIKYDEKKVYKAKDRRPVQVDPPVLKMIGRIAYAKDMPMYEVVRLAVEAYAKQLPDIEKTIYNRKR